MRTEIAFYKYDQLMQNFVMAGELLTGLGNIHFVSNVGNAQDDLFLCCSDLQSVSNWTNNSV